MLLPDGWMGQKKWPQARWLSETHSSGPVLGRCSASSHDGERTFTLDGSQGQPPRGACAVTCSLPYDVPRACRVAHMGEMSIWAVRGGASTHWDMAHVWGPWSSSPLCVQPPPRVRGWTSQRERSLVFLTSGGLVGGAGVSGPRSDPEQERSYTLHPVHKGQDSVTGMDLPVPRGPRQVNQGRLQDRCWRPRATRSSPRAPSPSVPWNDITASVPASPLSPHMTGQMKSFCLMIVLVPTRSLPGKFQHGQQLVGKSDCHTLWPRTCLSPSCALLYISPFPSSSRASSVY